MFKPPLVSIGLPTYNGARKLRRSVGSALAQDYPNLELIISDNASEDETRAICEEYAAHDARVRYLRQPSNVGASENFRRVLAESRGEFFMWLADDDWIGPNYVSACAEYLAGRPDCHVACGRVAYYRGDEFSFRDRELNLFEESGAARVLSYYRQTGPNGAFYGLMRRGAMDEAPPLHVLGGDWLFLSHMAFRGKVKTLEDADINRSLEGRSQDVESIARHYGLSDFQKRHIYLFVAASVFKDIAWRAPVFEPLGVPRRWVLASRSTAAVVGDYNLPRWLRPRKLWSDLRARLSLRTRLRLFAQRWLDRGH